MRRIYFFLLSAFSIVFFSASAFSQESDSASVNADSKHSRLYHILFDSENNAPFDSFDSLFSSPYRWYYHPWLAISSDDGFFIGASVTVFNRGSESDSLFHTRTLRGGIATGSSKYLIQYEEVIPYVFGGNLIVTANIPASNGSNFFGYGNLTSLDKNKYAEHFYRLNQQEFSFSPMYRYDLIENTSVWGSAALRYIDTKSDPIKDSSIIRKRYEYGVGKMTTMRFAVGGNFDSRDDKHAASNGILAAFTSFWTPEIINNKYAYTKFQADIRAYLSAEIGVPLTFALRMKAEKIFGEHPFYESCLLGGAADLRGYYQDRFAGEESLLGSAELRVKLGDLSIFVPETIGILLFGDAGRVYVDNDFSNDWHTSFGGGLWIAPVSKEHTITVTVSHSPESTLFYLGSGFTF